MDMVGDRLRHYGVHARTDIQQTDVVVAVGALNESLEVL